MHSLAITPHYFAIRKQPGTVGGATRPSGSAVLVPVLTSP